MKLTAEHPNVRYFVNIGAQNYSFKFNQRGQYGILLLIYMCFETLEHYGILDHCKPLE